MASLPVDITLNILSRLPVKSLVRSRCVCRSWNSFIRSPSFIKMHLNHWSNFPGGVDVYNYADDCVPQLAVYNPENSQHRDLDLPIDRHRGMDIEVIGSCKGVLCLSTYSEDNPADSKIFLWNPFINELEPLPESTYPVWRSIGFGWNDSAGVDLGEFKVVKINVTGKFPDRSSQVEVFGQRKNSWSQLGNALPPACRNHHLGPQVCVQNFICWCPCVRTDSQYRYAMKAWLVLFDVSNEEFHEEELPDTMPGEDKYIAVLDGCLSVIAQSRQPEFKGYEVWVMKALGSFHSWTKLYTIATSYDPCHRPLGFTSTGKLLFMRNFYVGLRFGSLTYLVLYDRTRDEFDSFSRRSRKGSFYKSRMVNHVASLVSPRAYSR